MIRFYKAKIVKKQVGTVTEHILPEFQGTIITDVYDITTNGDFRLFVVECTDKENQENNTMEAVRQLSLEDAIDTAALFQPARKIKTINPQTNEVEEQDIPAFDLRAYLSR